MAPENATESNEEQNTGASQGGAQFWTDLQTVPNMISLCRIVMILTSAGLYLSGYRAVALLLGVFAGLSDILDGWLARKLNQTTELGAILDRLSDLIMETVAFACLLHYQLLPPVYFIIYLAREFVVISARLYVAEKGETIPSAFFGKLKSDFVMGSFVGLFGAHSGLITGSELVYKIGFGMMIGGLVCSYISGAQYMRVFVRLYGKR